MAFKKNTYTYTFHKQTKTQKKKILGDDRPIQRVCRHQSRRSTPPSRTCSDSRQHLSIDRCCDDQCLACPRRCCCRCSGCCQSRAIGRECSRLREPPNELAQNRTPQQGMSIEKKKQKLLFIGPTPSLSLPSTNLKVPLGRFINTGVA